MKFRKLRIAFSVACGIACLLLIALWVRSYSTCDSLSIRGAHRFTSLRGQLLIDEEFTLPDIPSATKSLDRHFSGLYTEYIIVGSTKLVHPSGKGVVVPYVLLVLSFGALAAAPWIRGRFSLRTLLIATTLVAILLGTIVALSR